MSVAGTAPDAPARAPDGLVDRLRRRWHGTHRVDPWGLDGDVAALAAGLARLRAAVRVDGAGHLPATGGALVVANRGFDPAWVLALYAGLHRSGRFPRFVGVPDVEPLGPVLRRAGAVAGHPDEVASLLAAGEVVVAPLRPRWGGRAGGLAPDLVAPAVRAGAPIVPVAVRGSEGGIRFDLRVGVPVGRSRARPVGAAGVGPGARSPARGGRPTGLGVGEAVDATRRGIEDLLGG